MINKSWVSNWHFENCRIEAMYPYIFKVDIGYKISNDVKNNRIRLPLWWKTQSKQGLCCALVHHPRYQCPLGQYGAHLSPVVPRWAPWWPHEPCYLGWVQPSSCGCLCKVVESSPAALWNVNESRRIHLIRHTYLFRKGHDTFILQCLYIERIWK